MINNLVEFEVNYVHIKRKINRHPQQGKRRAPYPLLRRSSVYQIEPVLIQAPIAAKKPIMANRPLRRSARAQRFSFSGIIYRKASGTFWALRSYITSRPKSAQMRKLNEIPSTREIELSTNSLVLNSYVRTLKSRSIEPFHNPRSF